MSKTAAKEKKTAPASGKDEPRQPGTSALEWVVAAASGLGLTAVILFLIFTALGDRNGPAQIEVRSLGVTLMQDRYVVEFVAVNIAGKSVAAVDIKGELRDGPEVVEEAGVTLDYLPRESERTGVLIFRNDPAGHDLVLSAGGYLTP